MYKGIINQEEQNQRADVEFDHNLEVALEDVLAVEPGLDTDTEVETPVDLFQQDQDVSEQDVSEVSDTPTPDLADFLNEIKPTGSENFKPQAFEEESNATGARFFQQELTSFETQQISAVGALDETEFGFSQGNNPFLFGANAENNFLSVLFSLLDTRVSPGNKPDIVPIEIPVYESDVIFSNATISQTYINNTDHYSLKLGAVNEKGKIDGIEMDISGVSDAAFINYNYKSAGNFSVVLKSGWNSVKNVEVESGDLSKVMLKNFVHVDVTLTGDHKTVVKIFDAKRGFVETDEGRDIIFIKALSNGSGWSNEFDVDSGDGRDRITIDGSNGHTASTINAGGGRDAVRMKGDYGHADVSLGADRDVFRGGQGEDIVHGGGGNDVIRGDQGVDIAVFMGTIDEYIITQKGLNKIFVKDTVDGRDGRDVLTDVEGLIFGMGDLYADIISNWDAGDLSNAFGVTAAEDLGLANIISDYDPLQDAIDSFVQNEEQGQYETVAVQDYMGSMDIYSVEDLQQTGIVV